MGRTKPNIRYQLMQAGLTGLQNNNTVTTYKRHLRRFAEWCKFNSINNLSDLNTAKIQAYERDLEADPHDYSPSTIHKYLAPVCRATGLPMDAIRKPKRTSATITRSRRIDANPQGKSESEQLRFQRLVQLQQRVGIRRAELAHLTGADWDGKYVHVRRGKGGKEQYQYVLPQDRAAVAAIFDGVAADERLFSRDEMNNHIDLHALRAQHARDCYAYYLQWLQDHPDRRDDIRNMLIRRWDIGHQRLRKSSPEAFARHREAFVRDLRDEPYEIRSENRATALNAGRPVTYDRLALMCVSVLHLAHWRLGVTVTNYII